MVLMPNEQSSLITQPADRAFDLPSVLITSKTSSVLARGLLATSSMRCNLLNASAAESITKPICVRRFIIDQSLRTFPCDLNLNQCLDRADLGNLSRHCECGDRQPLSFRHQQKFCSFTFLGLTHLKTPFFAGENVPSPIACDQSSNFRRSSAFTRRSQALTMTPDSVHWRCRRQHVVKEGYRSGKSCHRAPVFKTHRMPSRHCRAPTLGRPPSGEGAGFSNRSSMRYQCRSLIKGFGAVLDPVVFGRRRCGHWDRAMSM